MTGIEDLNYVRFRDARRRLVSSSTAVVIPHDAFGGAWGYPDEVYHRVDQAMLNMCDEVYMLEGWQDSPGARREHSVAECLGKQISYEAMERHESD